ncbi:hypothetical protein BJ875DRAFT_375856 [Amylocarpus encephaloides]|uniref:TORC1 subunit TCO89 domain-containing protein n=1 Tax=Amylocarpus encephaloides TaxID=45428 RepID=A0A9P7YJJ7_9HELO|nr:hypothetical protein BJ875DRAFT_375856 [Amylocarpus encephaloides]
MPSENMQSQSHSQAQTPQPSTTSISSPVRSDSPSTSPHPQGKPKKHVVHHHTSSRIHTRVPSSKGLHKLTRAAHGNEGSHTDLHSRRNASATNLRKNTSNVSLKRNRSAAEKRDKEGDKERDKERDKAGKANSSVHFEIGDQDDGVWEEASSSASPALSRAPSRSGQSSAKLSANNSHPPSPLPQSPQTQDPPPGNGSRSHNVDAKIITEKLLQRTPSHNTTKMSLATATPSTLHSPGSSGKGGSSTMNGTPRIGSKEDVVSRFVSGSGTPSENSPYLNQHRRSQDLSLSKHDEVKRAQSMGNLTRHDSSARETDEEDESALAPRSRKSSATHAYNPPRQSRTQQKLWLQRASSNMEHTQIAPGVPMNGLSIHHQVGFGNTPLVGASYDGRDPRIKVQLEKTGLEYLVVRRHKDPVGLALKRLDNLPGAEKYRRIPQQPSHRSTRSDGGGSVGRYGLNQSLKDASGGGRTTTANGSYDGPPGSEGDAGGMSGVRDEDDTVSNILRGMWEKSFDLSASAD